MDAREIVETITKQNWKNGGVLVMDLDEAEALVQSALNAEREECAKYAQAYADLSSNEYGIVAGREIAKAIRARSET